MFVYNEYWSGKNAILVYPDGVYSYQPVYSPGAFHLKEKSSTTHGCGVMKMAVLDKTNNHLDNTIGKRINDFLEKKILA